jgi:excisionase family DNA binding protein
MARRGGEPEPLLTAKQVAVACHVSVRTVRRWIASEELPALKIGRLVRVQPAQLRRLISRSSNS